MTPTLLVNERSFVGQAISFRKASELLAALVNTMKMLRPRLAADRPLLVHPNLRGAQLTENLTLNGWLSEKQLEKEFQAVRSYLLHVLNAGPFLRFEGASAQSDETATYRLAQSDVDVTGSSVAAAAHRHPNLWLACLTGAKEFSAHPLYVVPLPLGSGPSSKPYGPTLEIPNFSEGPQVDALRLVYEPNDEKHHTQSRGRRSPMDLPPEEATEVLNRSITVPGKKSRYAVAGDIVYEFRPHRDNVYHGHQIARDRELLEVPLRILEDLGRVRC